MFQSSTRRGLLAAGLAGAATAGLVPRSTAAAVLPRATVAARRKHFGADNVDRDGNVRADRLILSWFGVTNFAVAYGGRVFLLDAWVPRGEYSGRVPTDPDELAALRPSHLFIGHAHWDHAADAAAILDASGARLVGTPEHVEQISGQATKEVRAVAMGTAAAPAGELAHTSVGPIEVTSLRHPHSAVKLPDGDYPPLLPVPDLTPILTHPPTLEDALHELLHVGDAEGGCLLYRFRLGRHRVMWNDTCGPVRDESAAPVRAWLRAQPRTDVHVGAIQGFGQFTNGLRDPMDYLADIRPRVFVPCHHDNWAPPVTAPAASYDKPLRDAIARLPEARRPRVRMLRDPEDYVRPDRLTFAL